LDVSSRIRIASIYFSAWTATDQKGNWAADAESDAAPAADDAAATGG